MSRKETLEKNYRQSLADNGGQVQQNPPSAGRPRSMTTGIVAAAVVLLLIVLWGAYRFFAGQ